MNLTSHILPRSEVECWSHAVASLNTLSNKYSSPTTLETIGRVNRLISAWPTDDTLPAEGLDGVKTIFKKLSPGLQDIRIAAEDEAKWVFLCFVPNCHELPVPTTSEYV